MITEFFKFNNSNKKLVDKMLSNINDILITDLKNIDVTSDGSKDRTYTFDFDGDTYKLYYIYTGRPYPGMTSSTNVYLQNKLESDIIRDVSNKKLLKLYDELEKHYNSVNKEFNKFNL